MIRVVIDTSVVISALLKPSGNSQKAFLKAVFDCIPIASFQTFEELRTVSLRPKFKKTDPLKRVEVLDIINLKSETIFIKSDLKICRDAKDDMFLNLAIDGKADVIISRDPDLLVLHPFQGISILNPADFLDWLENQ